MFKQKYEEKKRQKEIVRKHTLMEREQKNLILFQNMKNEATKELVDHLIPFWKGMKDVEQGGYYGEMSYDLKINKTADKSCSSNSRILGFFSVSYWNLGKQDLLEEADHSFAFLKESFLDQKNGGLFHKVSYDGKVKDTSKYTHEQAFAIYSLAAYYDATKKAEVIELARDLYRIIEEKCRDEVGYRSVFTEDFKVKPSEKFSKKGVPASRTMHTLVHVLEGYTGLLQVLGSMKRHGDLPANEEEWMEDIKKNIKRILDIISNKVYNPELGRQEAFFDDNYNSIIDLHPYGYDIETAWLIDKSTDLLEDEKYKKKMEKITKNLVKTIYNTAFDGHSMDNECEGGFVDHTRSLWVQSEAVIGFLNAYERDTQCEEYADAAYKEWEFIKNHMIDERKGSEWFSVVSKDGKPDTAAPIVDHEKCPYHNGRMCLEIIYRVSKMEKKIG